MGKILLDYVLDYQEVTGVKPPNLGYLKNVGVVVKGNAYRLIIIEQPAPKAQNIEQGSSGTIQINAFNVKSYRWQKSDDGDTWVDTGDTNTGISVDAPSEDVTVSYRCILEPIDDSGDVISDVATVTGVAVGNYSPADEDLETRSIPDFVGVTIYKFDDAIQYTDNQDIKAFFDAGLSALTLIMDRKTAADGLGPVNFNDLYTICYSADYTLDESLAMKPITGFDGVYSFVCSEKDKAKEIGKEKKVNCFYDAGGLWYASYYSFAKLLSGVYWRDKQYVQISDGSKVTPVTELGEADDLMKSGVSFYLYDDEYGTRLGFFGAGGEAVSEPYIDEEVKVILQGASLDYIALNEPRYTVGERIRLNERLQDVIHMYEGKPYLYLDPAADNTVTLTRSNEAYVVNGEMTIKVTEPIWRIRMAVKQG